MGGVWALLVLCLSSLLDLFEWRVPAEVFLVIAEESGIRSIELTRASLCLQAGADFCFVFDSLTASLE